MKYFQTNLTAIIFSWVLISFLGDCKKKKKMKKYFRNTCLAHPEFVLFKSCKFKFLSRLCQNLQYLYIVLVLYVVLSVYRTICFVCMISPLIHLYVFIHQSWKKHSCLNFFFVVWVVLAFVLSLYSFFFPFHYLNSENMTTISTVLKIKLVLSRYKAQQSSYRQSQRWMDC